MTSLVLLTFAPSLLATDKITFTDHVRPIFNTNCVSCHNPDKAKAGLDLTSFSSVMAGSSSAKVIEPGDPASSLLYMLVTHQAEPHMPLKGNKLPDAQLEIIRKWIEGGALESTSSSAAASSKPKLDFKVTAVASSGKPQGPVPMPKDLRLEPFLQLDRRAAPGALAVSPWAALAAIATPHQILLYDTQRFELLGVISFAEGLPKSLAFSRGGDLLLAGGGVGGQFGRVALYGVASGKRLAEIGQEYDEVLAADISPDNSTVAVGGPGKLLKIYATADGKLLHKLTQHTDWITAIAFSPDGVLLASGDRNGGLRVWEAVSGNEFYALAGHKAAVTRVCFRADSNVLASASEDGTVKLWDMNSGGEIKSIAAHGSGVTSVAFARDGRLVTGGRDHVVRIWKPDGTRLKDLDPFAEIVLHAQFANDDTAIIADDFAGEIRIASAADGKAIGAIDSNPPTIAQRLADLESKLAQAQANFVKASTDLAAAQDAAKKAAADVQPARILQFDLVGAITAFIGRVDQAGAAGDALRKAQAAAAAASAQLSAIKAEIHKYKLAQISAELAEARQALDALTIRQAEITDALKQLDQASKTIADGPRNVQAAEQKLASAKQAQASAAQQAAASQTALADRERAVKLAGELVNQLKPLAEKNPADTAMRDAAQKAKESLDLLNGELDAARRAASQTSDAAAKAAAELAAAESALAAAKSALAQAPAQLEQARAKIADSLGPQLAAAKARVESLTAKQEQMTRETVP